MTFLISCVSVPRYVACDQCLGFTAAVGQRSGGQQVGLLAPCLMIIMRMLMMIWSFCNHIFQMRVEKKTIYFNKCSEKLKNCDLGECSSGASAC